MTAGPASDGDREIVRDSEATMASFIVWLAGQRVPDVRRYHTHEEVDRFLRWSNARHMGLLDPRTATWSYLTEMRAAGFSEDMMANIWASLSLFLDYWEQRGMHGTTPRRQPIRRNMITDQGQP
jgi:hypothetical protein